MRFVHVIAITIVSLVGVQQLEAATLTWDSNPEPTVIGYRVSYGTQSGVHTTTVDVGKVITYVLSPPSGQRYYIVVQAYNQEGVSPKSAEVILDLTTATASGSKKSTVEDRRPKGRAREEVAGRSANVTETATDTSSAGADTAAVGDTADDSAPVTRAAADIPVSGDFDGDGLSDAGAFTAVTGEWRLWLSSIRYGAAAPVTWGTQDDVPVPADYDGDGHTDLAVFRPSTGTWSIVASNYGTPSSLEIQWGQFSDIPMPFDYDHDGRADLALRRLGGFDILLSSFNYTTTVTVR